MFINQLITSHNWGAPSCRHKMLGESLYGMFTINWCRISQPSTVRLGLEDLKGFVGSYLGVKLSVRCGKPKWFPKESDLQMVVFTHPCQFTGEYVCVVFVQYLHTIYYITLHLHLHVHVHLHYSTVQYITSVSFYMSSNPKKRCRKVCNQDVSSMISTSYFQVFLVSIFLGIAMHMYKIV